MTDRPPYRKRRLVSVAAVAIVAAIWFYRQLPLSESQRRSITVEARMWLGRGGFDEAEELMRRLAEDAAFDDDAHSVAAELSVRRRNYPVMQTMLRAIVDPETRLATTRTCARICMDQGVISDAAALYRQAVDMAPDDIETITELIRIYRLSGLNYEALPVLNTLVTHGKATTRDLGMLLLPNRFWAHDNDMTFAQSKHSLVERDILLEIAYGRSLYRRRQPDDALRIAERILVSAPDFVPAIALKGRALVDLNRDADFINWSRNVTADANAHPDIWYVRARIEQRQSNESGAARCFWECLNRDVRHKDAWHHLAQTLAALNRDEQAGIAEQRAEQLNQIQAEVVNFDAFGQPEYIERLIALSIAAHAHAEASAWCNLAKRRWPDAPAIERVCNNNDIHLPPTSVNSKDQLLQDIKDLADIPLPGIDNLTEPTDPDSSTSDHNS
jgi:tetratricopeptide (TPR) repeat protein